MHRYIKYFSLVCGILLLTSCSSTIYTQVNSFHQWQNSMYSASFRFEENKDAINYLEQKYYQKKIAKELESQGLSWQQQGLAKLLVKLDLHVIEEIEDKYVSAMQNRPVYVAPVEYVENGQRKFTPGHWVDYGFQWTNQHSQQVLFNHVLNLGIYDNEQKIYEAKASIKSYTEGNPNVVDYLIKSIFAEFPGNNGRNRQYRFDTKTGQFR